MADRSRGFTLIEMMIALSIFASLLTVLMFGYSQGLSLWERGRVHTHYRQSLEYRHGLLSKLFVQARVADYKEEKGKYVPYFVGKAREMRFLTRAPVLDFAGRIRPVAMRIEHQSDNTFSLVYEETGRFQDPGRGINWDEAKKIILLEGLQSGSFRFEAPAFPLPVDLDPNFLSADEKLRYRDNAEWLAWYNAGSIWKVPRKVAIRFVDKEGENQQWTFVLPKASDAWSLDVYLSD